MNKNLIFFFLLILVKNIYSQDIGGNPSGVKWKEINTDTVRVIFQEGQDKKAQRTVNMIHYMNEINHKSVGKKSGKINIVLQNQIIIPNGYVGIAPFRSEFYLTPPQNPFFLGSTDWVDGLAIHEYRHVLQSVNMRNGITQLACYIFGDYGWAALSNMAVPDWYFEGDAVVTETALSRSGRGRLPSFTLAQRALLLSDKRYSYMKILNGSYRDIVPNHYPLGYAMCSYVRDNYGNDVWADIIIDATKYKGIFYPFSKAVRRKTGMNTAKLYKTTYKDLKKKLVEELDTTYITSASKRNFVAISNVVTNYKFPVFLENNDVLCLKNSKNEISKIVILKEDKTEVEIVKPGIALDNYFSYNKKKIAWSELKFDKRWSNRNYSVIVVFDMNTNKKTYITEQTKYFSPCISTDGERIALIEVGENQNCKLKIINASNGELIKLFDNPDNNFMSYPKWCDNDNSIVVISKKSGKCSYLKYNIETGETVQLMKETAHSIGIPFVTDTHIYFVSSFSGIDNIYALALDSKKVFQLSSVKIGAYQPSLSSDGKKLIYSDYTIQGRNLCELDMDKALWNEISVVEPAEMSRYQSVANRSEVGNILDRIPEKEYKIADYNKLKHLINIHSWTPMLVKPNYGFSVISEDILSSLSAKAGYYFNTNENSSNINVELIYAGLYPVFKARVNNRILHSVNYTEGDTLNFTDNNSSFGVGLPLLFSKGIYTTQFLLQGSYNYHDMRNDINDDINDDFSFSSLEGRFTFINRRKKAIQNIYPKFSQKVSFLYNQSFDNKFLQYTLNSTFSFAGIKKNHNLFMNLGLQTRSSDNNNFYFQDNFIYPRGYSSIFYDDIYNIGLNYSFPLFYPEFGIRGIIYFSRIRANLFLDYCEVNSFSNTVNNRSKFRSYGGELIFDTKIINIQPISFGIRYSQFLDTDPNYNQFQGALNFFIATDIF